MGRRRESDLEGDGGPGAEGVRPGGQEGGRIASGTDAGGLLQAEADLGAIEPGKYADIVAVEGDALKDLTELERVRFVMKRGQVSD